VSDIQYGIEISAEDKYTATLGKVVDVTNTFDKTVNNLNKTTKKLDEGTKSVNKLSGAFKKLGKAGIIPVVDAIGAMRLAIELLKKAIAGTVGIAAKFEQWSLSFEVMLGSAERARDAVKDLVDFAAKTPFQIPGIMASAKQLLAVGFEADQLIPTLKAVGDVASGLSVPVERLILNLGQVKTQTYLTGRELRDFNIAGVPMTKALASALNKTEAEIKKMVERGEIGFGSVMEAFKGMSEEGGRFYNMMDRQNKTFLGQWSELKDNVLIIGATLGDNLLWILSPAMSMLNKLIGTARAAMTEFKRTKEDILPALKSRALSRGSGESADDAYARAMSQTGGTDLLMLKQLDITASVSGTGVKPGTALRIWEAEIKKRGGEAAILAQVAEDEAKKQQDAMEKMLKLASAKSGRGKVTPIDIMQEKMAALAGEGSARVLAEQALIVELLGAEKMSRKELLDLKIVDGLTEKQVSDLKVKYLGKEKGYRDARIKEIKDDMRAELTEVGDNADKKIAIYDKYMGNLELYDDDRADILNQKRKLEIKREKEFYDIIGDIAVDSLEAYMDVVQGKIDIDKEAKEMREDMETDLARAREDIDRDYAQAEVGTLTQRISANKRYQESIEALEIKKQRMIEDNDAKTRKAKEEDAEIMKNLYKKMATDYLLAEAAKSAAWFAGQIAKAIGSKNYLGAAVLGVQAGVSAAAFTTGISTIQGLETGGIVAGEGIYRMGEKNKKEAVIPLENESSKDLLREALGSGIGGETVIHNTMVIEGDQFDLMTQKFENNKEKLRKQGRL